MTYNDVANIAAGIFWIGIALFSASTLAWIGITIRDHHRQATIS